MCGIIAIAGNSAIKTENSTIEKMLGCLALRGPDDKGFERTEKCILGQTRLSIIDLSGGHQPMMDTELGLTIVFNGEIYNWKEERTHLESRGYRFQTNSDTEVIVKAYKEYGQNCVQRLDGMFAFAIWDERAKTLFVARDRFGKKPFYYAYGSDNTILFASEIKALIAGGIIGEIDPHAIDNYLSLMYIPPWKTVYKNIFPLPPAHRGMWKDGIFSTERYWSLPHQPSENVSYAEAKEKVRELLDQAVAKRMLAADVEVGALLSGGVDSTLICAYAQKHLDHPLKTFTVGYGDHINEIPFATEASRVIGTQQYTLQAHSDLAHELLEVITYLDEPHADSSLFPQHLISQLAASHVKVALSGDGADELFMGYGWYSKWWNTSKLTRLKNTFFSNQFQEHIRAISIFTKREREKLLKNPANLSDDILGDAVMHMNRNNIQKINLFDLTTYLPGQLLTKVDRTSMMHSLEMRAPFLDHKLAEYVYTLPVEYKMNKSMGKIILKELLTEIMPRSFVYRKKQGFGAPVGQWLHEPAIKKLALESLRSPSAHIFEFLNKNEVENLLVRFYEKSDQTLYYKIWSLLSLELWFRTRKMN